MKSHQFGITGLVCAVAVLTAVAAPKQGGIARGQPQPGMMGGGPRGGMMGGMAPGAMKQTAKMTRAMGKLFGKESAFTADIENETSGAQKVSVPGKLSFDQGKSRSEIDLSEAKGEGMEPQMAAQMKAMGMHRMVTISRPDKNAAYVIYPEMKAYVETDLSEAMADEKDDNYKVKATELGKETVDGHPAVKNKVVITEGTNNVFEATVWNATDLRNFPVKIEHTAEGTTMTTVFKNVKFQKPPATAFEVPSGLQKHKDMMELMQAMVMKQMGEMQMPPAQGKKKQ